MPCMNFTSASVQTGDAPDVLGGRILVGFPGAPGCTITGPDGVLVCCAPAAKQRENVAVAHSAINAREPCALFLWDELLREVRSAHDGSLSPELGMFKTPNYHELARRTSVRFCARLSGRLWPLSFRWLVRLKTVEFCAAQ
jgi:hypothetical protein